MTRLLMGKVELRYLASDVDRHGNARHYYREPGKSKIRLRQPYGTPAFLEEYQKAAAGEIPPAKSRAMPVLESGSLEWLVQQYYKSAAFKGLGEETQKVRRRILDKICLKHGGKIASKIETENIRLGMDERADRPEAANGYLKAMRGVFAFAAERKHVPADPTLGIRKIVVATDGFHTWSIDEIKQFYAHWPIGSPARLAHDLLFYTGLRRGDMVKLGRQHLGPTGFKVRTRKTKAIVEIPLLRPLAETIRRSECGELTFLVSSTGKAFTPESFGNWFRDRCNEAGLKHCTAHGLRKALATLLAERGVGDRQLTAVFGWSNTDQAAVYTRAAQNKKMAHAAMQFLSVDSPTETPVAEKVGLEKQNDK